MPMKCVVCGQLTDSEEKLAEARRELAALRAAQDGWWSASHSVACKHFDSRGPMECVFCRPWAIALAAATARATAAEAALALSRESLQALAVFRTEYTCEHCDAGAAIDAALLHQTI